MVCSELYGNMQRLAEMTNPALWPVTNCKYMNADVVLDGGFQGFSSDPFTADSASGTAVGGAPANSMYFLN